MTFQNLITTYFITSALGSCTLTRLLSTSLWNMWTPVLITSLFSIQVFLTVAFNIFIWPHISPLRILPSAPQKPVFQRLFKEPCPWHYESWTKSVPNDGLIKYYGILNIERVLITTPEVVKEVLQTKVYSFQKQYHQRSYFERIQGYGLVIQEGNAHKHARKLIYHTLNRNRVATDYWPIIQWKVSQMLQVIHSVAHNKPYTEETQPGSPVPLAIDELLQRTVFDVSGEVSYGMDFESILEPHKHYNAMDDYNEIFLGHSTTRERLILGFLLPKWLIDLLPIKYNLTCLRGLRHFDAIGHAFMRSTTRETAKLEPERSVMHELIAGGEIPPAELWEQYRMMLPGALHNTVSALWSTIWFLGQPRYAHIQTRLREELQTAFVHVDDAHIALPTFEKQPYLKAVVSEVLRLHPSASWFGREVAEPTVVNGVLLRKGLLLGISPWAFHRDPKIWGSDADEFRPERWLQSDKPMTTGSENAALITFGAGPRRCVGEQLAKAELYCVIPRLFRRYEVRLLGVPPKISHHVTVAYREPINVSIVDHGAGEGDITV